MIVVDVGCATQGPEESTALLIERFQPDVYYGFDPWPGLLEADTVAPSGRRIVFERAAAWTRDGEIDLAVGETGINATVMFAKNQLGEWGKTVRVRCFDLAEFLWTLPTDEVVLKIDAEGAEFPLLEHLVDEGADLLLELLLVEWHDDVMDGYAARKERLLEWLACPVEQWG